MAVTLQTLRDTVYDILREEDQDSSAYPYSLVDLLLNSAQQRICMGRIVNPMTKEEVRKGQLPFLNTDAYFSNIGLTTLSADATVGDTELDITSTTDFPSAGKVFIGGNVITYTGKTATTFTGVTGVLFAFQSGQQVSTIFTLPSDYGTMINVIYNNKFKLPGVLYDDIYENLNQYKGTNYDRNQSNELLNSTFNNSPFYSIKDRQYLLIYNKNQTGDMIKLRYEKIPAEMTIIIGATIDNDIYCKTTIPYIAIGELMYNRGEEGRGSELLNFGIGQVREMYNYYNNSMKEKMSGVQYGMGKSTLNI